MEVEGRDECVLAGVPLAGRERDADFTERWGWLDGERRRRVGEWRRPPHFPSDPEEMDLTPGMECGMVMGQWESHRAVRLREITR